MNPTEPSGKPVVAPVGTAIKGMGTTAAPAISASDRGRALAAEAGLGGAPAGAPVRQGADVKAEPSLTDLARGEAGRTSPTAPATPASAPPPPGEDSFSKHYTAIGEAVEADYRDFGLYMRDLADKGELVGADGKPLPMYSREKIANMTIPELKAFVNANPRYANQFFPKPSSELLASLEGTGRTGVGSRSGMVEVPPIPTGGGGPAKPAPTPAPEAPAPEDTHSEATMVGAGGGAKPEEIKQPFGDKLKKLATDYGIPILDILQAVGYQRGGIDKPTRIEQKYAEKIKKEEQDYMKKLEDERLAGEDVRYEKRITNQRTWDAQQAELNRLADKAARGEELTAREKIARMQIEASRAASKAAGGTASYVPE